MSTRTTASMPAVLVISASALFASGVAAVAQSATGSTVPSFIDARPLPQTDRARSDELEARRKADDELKRLTAENDAKRRSDEETKRIAADADAKRIAAEADAKRRADEETKRFAANAEATRLAAEADAKRRADEESKRLAADADAKRLATEADAKRRADENTKRLAADDERRLAEANDSRRKAVDDAQKTASELEAKRAAQAADARRAAEAEAARAAAAIAAAKLKTDEEARIKAAAAAAVTPAPLDTAAGPAGDQLGDATRFATRGHTLLVNGNVAQARGLLERAANFGSASAALDLAQSFDAEVLAKWPVIGVLADKEMARKWYIVAKKLGAKEADDALARLAK